MELKILLAAIANGKYYGGGMLPAPEAEIDDGLFDICLVSEVSRLQILDLFPKYMKGLHGQLKQVSFHKGKKINIESSDNVCLNIDGEIVTSKSINFEILESAINVIFPVMETEIVNALKEHELISK
jgi:diacylglycerol kinase family enzyme